eukprot:6054504-Pyramimonas_sp.AAC.1
MNIVRCFRRAQRQRRGHSESSQGFACPPPPLTPLLPKCCVRLGMQKKAGAHQYLRPASCDEFETRNTPTTNRGSPEREAQNTAST